MLLPDTTMHTRMCWLSICFTTLAGVGAQWVISEDISLGQARVMYKGYKDMWMVAFDDSAGDADTHTIVVPQLCRGADEECSLGQINFAHVSCATVNLLLLDPAWYNENAAADLTDSTSCPSSFADAFDAQVLLGSVMPEPFVFVAMPTTLTIRNNETLLARFDRGGSSSEWHITVRLLFLTEMVIGSERVYTVRRYVARLSLSRPEISIATLMVQSACAAVGLQAPVDAQLDLRTAGDGKPVCTWRCRIDAMRTPWNAAPTPDGGGQCRPLRRYFTATEFAFTVDTGMPGAVPSRLSSDVLDSVDVFAARIEAALGGGAVSLVALTVPRSDFDTTEWRAWVHELIAFTHRNDAVLATNATLVVDALRALGLYAELQNPAFTYSWRRYSVQDIVIKGIWFTDDVTTDTRTLAALLQRTVAAVPHAFPERLHVLSIAQVDVARVHRLALPPSTESAVEVRMQRDAVAALGTLCVTALCVAALVALLRLRATTPV